MQIKDLPITDELLLTVAEAMESIVPSRCTSCGSANILDTSCFDGTVCGFDCGGYGFVVSCGDCGIVINESECEEAEEE